MDSEPSHTFIDLISRIVSKISISSLIIVLAFSFNILTLTSHDAVAATKDAESIEKEQEEEEKEKEKAIKDAAIKEQILWFARAIYSETKVPAEQRLVAWVVRNRVEAQQYPDTYKDVVLQPNQFSGLNSSDFHYYTNISLKEDATLPGWATAYEIAQEVYNADSSARPISETVWHFYSPISASRTPSWALGSEPVHESKDFATGTVRFAFFANVQ